MSKIDTTGIEGFENMTADEKVSALLAMDLPNADAGDDVTKLKNLLSKANSEAADYKRQLKSRMSEDEVAKAEQAAKQKDLEDKYNSLLRESTVSKNMTKFMALGMEEKLAAETSNAIFDNDTETVFKNMAIYKESMEKAIRADALKATPKPQSASAPSNDDYAARLAKARADGDTVSAVAIKREARAAGINLI